MPNAKTNPRRRVIEIKPIVDPDAKVYPRSINGYFQRWRWAFIWLTQLVFYGLCWLPWNGRQAVLFDLDTRRFYLFDLVLWPPDAIYLAILLALSALALFPVHRCRRALVVRLYLSANGLHRDVSVVGKTRRR